MSKFPIIALCIIGLALTCGLVFFILDGPTQMPHRGDCLVGPDTDFHNNLEIVDCSDNRADYEVVAQTTSERDISGICRDHPDGQPYEHARHDGEEWEFQWVICVVPL